MPALGSPPKISSKDVEHRRMPPGAYFKCGKARHWVKNCPSPYQQPGPCPNCGQAEHREADCPDFLRHGRPVLQVPTQQESLLSILGMAV